jgi:hypothetical protein
VTVVSPNSDDRETVKKAGAVWQANFHPWSSRFAGEHSILAHVLRRGRQTRYMVGLFLHLCPTYFLNTLSGFAGFSARIWQSFSLRKIYLRSGLSHDERLQG